MTMTVREVAAASPHTRGWTVPRASASRDRRGFPAHAGMDPLAACSAVVIGRLPRTRGDGPCALCRFVPAFPASPHTRGWTADLTTRPFHCDGFPAHAGMDRPADI